MDDAIYVVLAAWLLEWCSLDKTILNQVTTPQQKKERQQWLHQLEEKIRQGWKDAS